MSDAPGVELSKPSRRLAWSEITDAQKIERMHDIVKQEGRELDRLREELYKLRYHQHKENGDMLIPYSHSNSRGEIESMASPEAGPWF